VFLIDFLPFFSCENIDLNLIIWCFSHMRRVWNEKILYTHTITRSWRKRILFVIFSIHIFLPRSSDPTCRSDRFRSDPYRISSESDIFHKKPIGSATVLVGFLLIGIRSGFHRNSTERDGIRPDPTRISSGSAEFRWNPDRIPIERNPTKTVSDPIEIFRSDRIRSPLYNLGHFLLSFEMFHFYLLSTTQSIFRTFYTKMVNNSLCFIIK
jgi:hypothetical protein